jgi:hypothetical protein
MANFATLDELIRYALFRSGELTSGALGDGDFYNTDDGGQVLQYINDTLEGLILGSALGLSGEAGQPLPSVDWWWARKQPPGVLILKAPVSTGTVSVTKGLQTLTFSTLLTEGTSLYGSATYGSGTYGGPLDLTGHRIRIGSSAYLPRIASTDTTGNFTVATLDAPWPDTSVSAGVYTAFKLEYDLASDFVRFAGEPTLSKWPWTFPVIDTSTLEDTFPIAAITGGTPQAAALIGSQRIRLSHYPLDLERVEYPYIYLPDKLTLTSTELFLPPHHRRILGVGAAYFITYDKADSKAGDIRAEFHALFRAMVAEHNKHQRKMSRGFGALYYRLGQVRGLPGQGPLRTASGLIIGP